MIMTLFFSNLPEADTGELLQPELWVDRHGDVLFRYALARLRNRELAENAVQETFLAALKGRDSFTGRSSERTWLVGILKRKVFDHFRHSRREEPVDDPEAVSDETRDLFDERGRWKVGPTEWAVPGASLEKNEFWRALERCLNALPDRLHRAFFLREMDDLETDELCKVLAVTETNLWVMLHRARARLRQCLETGWFAATGEK
jgi:RNA polymerase sigma-70 factor (ECF subfamily)